ncbi:hypothetical protein JTB14_032004 [Gonioctena quinquepunctata]|nr:hypothetical protein JTB14_032004 [Gonioctena quinquepunctata]
MNVNNLIYEEYPLHNSSLYKRNIQGNSLGLPLRVARLFFLGIVLPCVLLSVPLYMRYRVYGLQLYPLAMSDMRMLDSKMSTTWCQRQLVKVNATFNAFLLSNNPQISKTKKPLSMVRELDLEDDTKEYWGFYLLKGTAVTVSTCVSKPGWLWSKSRMYPLIVSYETEYQNTKEEGKESGRKYSSKDQDDNDELEKPSCSSETGKENELDKNKNYSNSNDNFCQRRRSRKHTTPLRYGDEFCKLDMDEPIPYEDAISGTEKEQWKKAIVEELESMEKNKVWDIVDVEIGQRVVGCRWAFEKKISETGEVSKYKARPVAQGFSQVPGVDF